jgi:hypothetical protein
MELMSRLLTGQGIEQAPSEPAKPATIGQAASIDADSHEHLESGQSFLTRSLLVAIAAPPVAVAPTR